MVAESQEAQYERQLGVTLKSRGMRPEQWAKLSERDRLKVKRCKALWSGKRTFCRSVGIEFTLEFADIEWPTHCPVLGIKIDYFSLGVRSENSPSLDRIIPSEGYVPGNVLVISWRANRIKSDGSPEELKAIAEYAGRETKRAAKLFKDKKTRPTKAGRVVIKVPSR